MKLTRISESIIREIVKPFKDDYGETYAGSRYIRTAQRQLEHSQQEHDQAVREIFEEIEKYNSPTIIDLGLVQFTLCTEDWQALKQKWGGE